MKVLILKGELYLQPTGEWSANRETAREFESSSAAYQWAREQLIADYQVVLESDGPAYDFVPLKLYDDSSASGFNNRADAR
jgi:hypothetical protein